MCPIWHPLACSWRSLSPCDSTAAVALSLYMRARRSSLGIWLSLLVFSRLLFASLFRDLSRLSRRSAFVSAGVLFSCFFCFRLFTALDSAPSLCFASISSLPRLRLSLVACDFYTCKCYTHTVQCFSAIVQGL